MRHWFGQDPAAWTMALGAAVEVSPGVYEAPVATRGPVTISLWSDQVGGDQYTDLLDASGLPITVVTSADGSGALPAGTIPRFRGPENVTEMWADAGGGVRYLLVATDLGAVIAALETRVADAENLLGNLEALAAAAIVAVIYDEGDSTWPVRPAIAGSRIVHWYGPNASPPPSGYMLTNDQFFGWAS